MDDLLVALDFDGTLAPIVSRPEDAMLDSEVRATLALLARQTTLVVLSGRDRADVKERVAVEGIIYAGCHGLDIRGPNVTFVHEAAALATPRLAEATTELTAAVGDVGGLIIEPKAYSVAVHYRLADEHGAERILAATTTAVKSKGLRLAHGKKVLEMLPDAPWDKGRALSWLIEKLQKARADTIYIGDDRTDEDAFRELEREGLGVLVAAEDRPTSATRRLRAPHDVHTFLAELSGARR